MVVIRIWKVTESAFWPNQPNRILPEGGQGGPHTHHLGHSERRRNTDQISRLIRYGGWGWGDALSMDKILGNAGLTREDTEARNQSRVATSAGGNLRQRLHYEITEISKLLLHPEPGLPGT